MNKGQSHLICNHINNCFCSFNVKLSMLQFVFIPSLIIMNTATHCLWALYCETGTRQTREIIIDPADNEMEIEIYWVSPKA